MIERRIMKKISLALIISSVLAVQVFAVESGDLKQMLDDGNIGSIEAVLKENPTNAEASFMAAIYYGKNNNISKQLEYLQQSADLGFTKAQLQYGVSLLNQGKVVEGLTYLEKSADQNYVPAMTLLGDLYFAGYFDQGGNEVLEQDFEKSEMYLKRAVSEGSQDARYTLAYLYLSPESGQQNIDQSIALFEDNIDYVNQSGHLPSIMALIDIYSKGEYVKADQAKLTDYLYLASLQDYSPAFYSVGVMQREGFKGDKIIIEKNPELAFDNIMKATKSGYLDAMFRLGEMYFKGEGTKQSDVDAYIWMAIAEEFSNVDTKYSETILELIPKKERQSAIDKKNHQYQLFSVKQ